MTEEAERKERDWPRVVILLLTWAGPPKLNISKDRLEYTKRTINCLKEHFLYPNYSWHVADDGSPPAYQAKVFELLKGESFTFSDTRKGWDVNNNVNIGMGAAFAQADVVATWPDDRFLTFDLNVRSYVKLLTENEDICHIRINRAEPGLKGIPIERAGYSWRLLDRTCRCTHVIQLGPNVKHKRYVEHYGYFPTGIWPAGRAENELDMQFRTQEGPDAVMPEDMWDRVMMPWGGKSTWEKPNGGLAEEAMPPKDE